MAIGKKILKHPITQYGLSWLLAAYIALVKFSSRIDRHIHPEALPYMQGKQNGIFAFWHGRMMLLPAFCPPRRQMHVLISLHRDGLLISQVIAHFGQKTVSGSSSRGGKEAVTGILKLLEAGDNISITPDGPRGPVHVAAQGVASIAKFSGRPVLPVTFHSSRAKEMRSWDRFMLALPFGRIRFLVGKPLHIAEDVPDEQARTTIEQAMNELLLQAQHA